MASVSCWTTGGGTDAVHALCSLLGGRYTGRGAPRSGASRLGRNRSVKVTGTVTKIEWANPRVRLYLNAIGSSATGVMHWELESQCALSQRSENRQPSEGRSSHGKRARRSRWFQLGLRSGGQPQRSLVHPFRNSVCHRNCDRGSGFLNRSRQILNHDTRMDEVLHSRCNDSI
jgi:hypothetical protein